MNRLLSKTPDPFFAAPPVTFTYHPSGTRATMTDALGLTNYSYSILNRLTSKSTATAGVNYQYDAAGNLTRLDVPGFLVNHTYQLLNNG